jgi:hypothetical protein
MNNRPLLIFAAAVLAICVGAVWFLQTQPKPVTVAVPNSTSGAAESSPSNNDTAVSPQISPEVRATPATESRKPPEPSKPLAEWEVKIDQALRADVGETETAQLLINMLPTLPPDGQAEAAQHISNLLLDKDYNRVLPLVKNPNLPEEVLDVFVTDLMNRDDPVKLPVLLEIAKIPNHPHREEAQTDLQIFLDEDYGNDWAKWQAAMKNYLAKQAAEEAADAAAPAPAPPPAPGAARPGLPPRR